MVDPTAFVARRVGGNESWVDIVAYFEDLTKPDQFLEHFGLLRASVAGLSEGLKRFRSGDLDLIAVEKLTKPDESTATKAAIARYEVTRKRFFANLREATQHLQDICVHLLNTLKPRIEEIQALRDNFWEQYGNGQELTFDVHTLTLRGKPSGPDAARKHDKEVLRLRKRFSREPHVARIALDGLPAFQARTGVDDEKLYELFAVETANLILMRILLLRFFEDHGFLGHRKYVCNGGVAAFQKMREYFRADEHQQKT
jgi:hypothetical protein